MGLISNINSFYKDLKDYRSFKKSTVSLTNPTQFKTIFKDWLDNLHGEERNTGYIAACANIWGLSFAKAKSKIYDITDGEEVEGHPYYDLIRKPNWFQTMWEIEYRRALDLIYEGDSYLLKLKDSLGVPRALIQMHPDRVQTYPYNYEKIESYIYNTGTGLLELPKDDVIHFRLPSQSNYIHGEPLINKIADVKEIEKLQLAYRRQFYKAGGFLGAVFTTDQKMQADSFQRAKAELQANYAGSVENAFKVALFEQGLTPVPTAYSLKDMDMTAERNLNRDEILSIFGVNKILFGQSENIQRGNADTVYYVFYNTIIDPLLDYTDQVLTAELCAVDYDKDYYIQHDKLAQRDLEMDLRYYRELREINAVSSKWVAEQEGIEYDEAQIQRENELLKPKENDRTTDSGTE